MFSALIRGKIIEIHWRKKLHVLKKRINGWSREPNNNLALTPQFIYIRGIKK